MTIRRSKLLACLAASALALAGRSEAQVAPAPVVYSETAPSATSSVQLDYLFIHRSRPNSQPLVRNAAGTILDAGDFDFGWDSGISAKFISQSSDCVGFEFRYLGIYGGLAQDSRPVPAGAFALVTNPETPVGAAPDGTTVNSFYRSDINSFEVNGRASVSDRVTLIAGVRYLDLNERLNSAFAVGDVTVVTLDTLVDNNLYGMQTGIDVSLWKSECSKLRVDGFVRAGFYLNDASTSLQVAAVAPGGAATVISNSDSQTRGAFVADLGVSASYQVSQNLSVRAGYQFLWLSGVALASEQLSTSSPIPPTGTGTPNLNFGDVYYNGINFGVEYRW